MQGVPASPSSSPYLPGWYCECEQDYTKCGYSADVENCDTLQGNVLLDRFFILSIE